ncbi:MAG TPA: glycosyltransferase [Bryobacteraceae bacterium]|nr:glycosyltransferase [Bryobacteraceae bacterium]
MGAELLAALSLVIWLFLLFARGGFWRMRDGAPQESTHNPAARVVAVIPARNEAPHVARAIASLAAQSYPGPFHIVFVDDSSTDGTAEAARAAASPELLTIVRAPALPAGWTGKLWAVSQGVAEAAPLAPDFLLLTDADIVHPPEAVAGLVARAETSGCDLVSLMVSLHCKTVPERALIPAFVFFFFLLYPPRWIANRRRKDAGAAGGCMLVRREALEGIGGVESIRGELIDDCALARVIKRSGGAVKLDLSSRTHSLREYRTFSEIAQMISRNAFTQLHHSALLLAAAAAGLLVTYIAPLALIFTGPYPAALLAGIAWALMCVAYAPVLRFYRRSTFWAPLLPLVALFYLGATIHSAIAYWRGTGGMWKGRAQDTREAERGLQ